MTTHPSLRTRFRTLRLCLLSALASTVLIAQKAPWSVVLLQGPLHVGDDHIKSYQHPRPEVKAYRAEFEMPQHVKHSVADSFVLVVSIADLVMPRDKHRAKAYRDGKYRTKVLINHEEIVVLNKLAKVSESPANVDRIEIELKGTAFRDGMNVLEIVPGADGKNLDDFEIHRIELIAQGQ